jgi:hypothetical protein
MSISITVTNPAMITMYAGNFTDLGITFFSSDITKFEPTNTKVVAKPIPIPFTASVVTANVGHIPNNDTRLGFSLIKPLVNSYQLLCVLVSAI